MSKLQKIMNERNLSQKELAEQTGLSTTYISYFINGKRGMSVYNAKKIARALKIGLDDFLWEEGE